MGDLAGRVAVITGAGRGIGKGIAIELAKCGARVAVTSLHQANAEKVSHDIVRSGGQAIALSCDVNRHEAIDSMVERVIETWGRVDILVNNAQGSMGTGMMLAKPFEDTTTDDMWANFCGGVMASMWAMQAVFPSMRREGWGRIVNLSSLNGHVGRINTTPYNVAKEGIRAVTRTAAREWSRFGITVNTISPTILSDSVSRSFEANEGLRIFLDSTIPLGRPGTLEDVGRVVAFLASDDAALITGSTFMVDKGRHMDADARILRYPGEPITATTNLDNVGIDIPDLTDSGRSRSRSALQCEVQTSVLRTCVGRRNVGDG